MMHRNNITFNEKNINGSRVSIGVEIQNDIRNLVPKVHFYGSYDGTYEYTEVLDYQRFMVELNVEGIKRNNLRFYKYRDSLGKLLDCLVHLEKNQIIDAFEDAYSGLDLLIKEAKNLHMDYTFLMEDDTYIHVEFQTTDKGKDDLRRFRAYESLLSFQTGKDVVTYVVYSNGIQNVKSVLETGINQYNVKAVSMYDRDGDIVIKEIEEKIKDNVEVTKQDLIALTFTPIMSGKLSKLDKIIKSINLVKKIDNEYRYDVESMLYAFADKFLDVKDLEKVKEEISMTKLGEMLVEDGIKKGKIEGKEEQAIETAKVAIKEGMSDELITKLTGLTESQISIIRKSINN